MAKDTPKQEVTGGPFFFFSLVCLLILGVVCIATLPALLSKSALSNLAFFACSATCGGVIAHFFIRAHLSVFLHELKHSIISNFAGNRAKGMKIRSESGHFQYEYTKDTAKFNAFISLAPYWVPLFTIPALGVAYLFWNTNHATMALVVGLGFGVDAVLNSRDISPIQTDLTLIRGGYLIGLLYVIAMNLVIVSFLLAWVMAGPHGILEFIKGLWELIVQFVPKLQTGLNHHE